MPGDLLRSAVVSLLIEESKYTRLSGCSITIGLNLLLVVVVPLLYSFMVLLIVLVDRFTILVY